MDANRATWRAPAQICRRTYDNVASLHKLEPRLPNADVDEVDEVAEDVTDDPVHVGGGAVVREGQPGRAEPDVVVVGQRYQRQPGDVAAICSNRGEDVSCCFSSLHLPRKSLT